MLDNHWSAKVFVIASRLVLVVMFAFFVSCAVGWVYYGSMEWRGKQEAAYLSEINMAVPANEAAKVTK
ncbi:hypothetical protein VXS06_14775 [Photobacterium toruni]|uniref:Uncharacterized protein n=1 Tax=Photobacterium toruni TaxID=1935446 RepID=A0ABU6L8Z3_9GAMM|nr:hypothetical protein [Photobacterium toruni]